MSLAQLNFDGRNKVDAALDRILKYSQGGTLYFADSYGKDSSCVRRLLQMAKPMAMGRAMVDLSWEAHYHQTGIDPPELVKFGRRYHPDTIIDKPKIHIWEAIARKGLPVRTGRWCCELLKEYGGEGRTRVTGVRWAESNRRRRIWSEFTSDSKRKDSFVLNPIIDWGTEDVWEFIRTENIPYCELYDEGFSRLGCVMCPLTTKAKTKQEMERWPKLAEAWHRATIRRWEQHTPGTVRWKSGEEMWQWWIGRGE